MKVDNHRMSEKKPLIDGDSMGLVTILCTISSLSQVSLKQNFAATGAINQYGEVLGVEKINKKIEGWYRTCHMSGLTGHQGVVIPKDNLGDISLPVEIEEALTNRMFHIYGVETIDQALEIFTGRPAKETYEKAKRAIENLDLKDGDFLKVKINFDFQGAENLAKMLELIKERASR